MLTTIQLTYKYGVEPERIRENLNENKQIFIKKTDYYILNGDELKLFNNKHPGLIPSNKSRASLWTANGAFKHAGLINMQKTWKAFYILLDKYFFESIQPANNGSDRINDIIDYFDARYNEMIAICEEIKELSCKVLERFSEHDEKKNNCRSERKIIASEIAAQLNLRSKSNLPHCQLIGAIAKTLHMPINMQCLYEDDDIVIAADQSNLDGFWQVYYKSGGAQKIIDWFMDNKAGTFFSEYYKKDTKTRKKGEVKGQGYKINGKRYWVIQC